MKHRDSRLFDFSQESGDWWLLFGFVATIILSLLPFFKVGFTTSDDVQYFVTAQQSWQYWLMDHRAYAEGQGRFYFLITKFFYYVPYLADNFLVAKLIQYATLLGCYLMFAYLVYRICRSRTMGLVTLLLLVFNTCVTRLNYFVAVTAYPFYFTFSFLIFMCGVLLLVNHYQRGSRWNPVWAGLLFFVSALFYENYVVFILLVALYVFLRHWRRDGITHLWRSATFWRELAPMVLSAVVYVALYVGYRHWLVSTMPEAALYGGAQLSDGDGFSLSKFFRLVIRLTLIALPGQTYFHGRGLIADNSLLLGGLRSNPFYLMTHASAIVIVNALLQCLLFVLLCRRLDVRQYAWRKLLAVLAGAMLFAFSANMLVAVTPKYQEWSGWLRAYVTSFYSYFGVALAMAVFVVLTLKMVSNQRGIRLLRGFWAFLIFFFAIIIGTANEHLSREWQRSQNRFVVIDEMAREGYFDTLPDDALLYTEALHTTSRTAYSICEGTIDVENYIALRAGRKFHYAIDSAALEQRRAEFPSAPCYLLGASEVQKGNGLLVTVADSTGADCFYLSPVKHFNLFYKDGDRWHRVTVGSDNKHRKVTKVRVEGGAIAPDSIYVSDMIEVDYNIW
ncbi:MAG: hypothetical protein IKN84_05045 [Bacteroidales bacterium]|jgi:hypothetical protein|nr:hypothetical protein [Bacteroidales bacterium]